LYYRDLGMSGLQLGVLMALPSLWTALTGPLWGSVADSLAVHRLLLRIVLVAAAAIALLATQPVTFVSLLVLMSVLAFTLVPIPALLDSYAVNVAERTEQSYGSLRVWGSIGFTVMVLVTGRILGDRVTSQFLFYYAGCLVAAWLSIFGLPHLSERRPRPLLDGLQAVRRSKPFLLLLLVAYLLASGYAVIASFLGIHIQELGGSTGQVGLAYAISAVTELPVLVFSGWILTRLGSRRVLEIAICFYLLRFGLLSFAPSPEWIILAQGFHGLSFGAFLIASVTLAHRLVGRDNAATAQAVLGTMSFGFGSITGSLTAGALLDIAGTYAIFRGVTVLMVVTLVIFVVGNRITSVEGNDPAPA
jgi:PPP family 3-phenylpropionic acid transporter